MIVTSGVISVFDRGCNIFDQPIIKLKKNRSLRITLHYNIAFLSQYK